MGILKFLCAVRLSNQRCGSVGDAVCRHIAQALGGDCDVVGSQRNGAQRSVDAGDDNLTGTDGGVLQSGRNSQLQRTMDDLSVGLKAVVQRDAAVRLAEQGSIGDAQTGDGGGDGGRNRSAGNAPSCTRDGEGHSKQLGGSSWENQEEVEHDVEQVGSRVENQWGLGISHAPQNGREGVGAALERQGKHIDLEVTHGIRQDIRLRTHPLGQMRRN